MLSSLRPVRWLSVCPTVDENPSDRLMGWCLTGFSAANFQLHQPCEKLRKKCRCCLRLKHGAETGQGWVMYYTGLLP